MTTLALDNRSVGQHFNSKILKRKGTTFKGQEVLTLEDGIDTLPRKVGKGLPLDPVYYPRKRKSYQHHGGSLRSQKSTALIKPFKRNNEKQIFTPTTVTKHVLDVTKTTTV
jgi:hypothetical protein